MIPGYKYIVFTLLIAKLKSLPSTGYLTKVRFKQQFNPKKSSSEKATN